MVSHMKRSRIIVNALCCFLLACQPTNKGQHQMKAEEMNSDSLIRELSNDELLRIVGTNIPNATPKHAPIRFSTPEELASMRVDYDMTDIEIIRRVLHAAARVLTHQTTVEQEHASFGQGTYSVPKLPSQPINSWGHGIIYRSYPDGGAVKGIWLGFRRNGSHAPWEKFTLTIQHPYEFVVNVPVTKAFFEELGLVFIKGQEKYPCDNASGKCNAFFYRSTLYPQLSYTFLTDPERADLKSGVASNFREVKIEIQQQELQR